MVTVITNGQPMNVDENQDNEDFAEIKRGETDEAIVRIKRGETTEAALRMKRDDATPAAGGATTAPNGTNNPIKSAPFMIAAALIATFKILM